MSFTNQFENIVMNHLFKSGSFAYTAPSPVYVGLYYSGSAPTDSTSGTEVTGSGYIRQIILFSSAAAGSVNNNNVITFPSASGENWGSIGHWGGFDAQSAGTLMVYGNLETGITVNDGDVVRFATSSISITLD